MQRDAGRDNANLLEPPEQRLGQVQSGGRSGHGPRTLGKDGLIALAVCLGHFPVANVGRERHTAHALEQFQRRALDLGPRDPRALRLLDEQPQLEFLLQALVGEHDVLSGLQFSAGLGQQPPVALLVGRKIQAFPAAAGRGAVAHEPGRNHFRVVDDQGVAAGQQTGQIANMMVLERPGGAIHDQ